MENWSPSTPECLNTITTTEGVFVVGPGGQLEQGMVDGDEFHSRPGDRFRGDRQTQPTGSRRPGARPARSAQPSRLPLPESSDAVYDQLFARLEELEQHCPELRAADSPTQRVGAEPVGRLAKVRHRAPLLSLQATPEEDKVESFMRTVEKEGGGKHCGYYLEPKFDGFSVEIVYEKGDFKYGATPLSLQRGDETPATLALRGEVFIPRKGFIKLNKRCVERGEGPFANPRNAAAGLMRQLATEFGSLEAIMKSDRQTIDEDEFIAMAGDARGAPARQQGS